MPTYRSLASTPVSEAGTDTVGGTDRAVWAAPSYLGPALSSVVLGLTGCFRSSSYGRQIPVFLASL